MVYINESGAQIASYDLTKGYLVDAEWVDHPAVEQSGHYEYNRGVQTFVVDTPAQAAWREITVQKFILYTEEELTKMNAPTIDQRVSALEEAIIMQ